MNRLTKKAQFVRNLITGKEIKYISNESDQMCVDKLGALEDIEEELGIDLITLFKALRNGIWTNQEQWYGDEKQGKIRFFQVRLLLEENAIGCIHNSMWKGKEVIRTLYFNDYGKTWALTKEELENEKDNI